MISETHELLFRLAALEDVPQLNALIPLSVHQLQAGHYSDEQRTGALGVVFGVDTQLIRDGTYFVAEVKGQIVGSGGWSRRKTAFGSDQGKTGADLALDPAVDAARIRAFFVHPDWARRGIGTKILTLSESAAIAAGFSRIEIVATLTGEKLYEKYGYTPTERWNVPLVNGAELPVVKMAKSVSSKIG